MDAVTRQRRGQHWQLSTLRRNVGRERRGDCSGALGSDETLDIMFPKIQARVTVVTCDTRACVPTLPTASP